MANVSLYQQALHYHRQGQLSQAERLYCQILNSDPNHADSLHYLGLLYYQTERSAQAKNILEKALTISPNHIDLIQHYSLCLRDLGEFELAIQHLKKAQAMRPDDADLLQNLANTYWIAERYHEAVGLFSELLQHDQDNTDIRDSLLSVLSLQGNQAHQQGDYALAQQCFQRALGISAESELFYNLANAERELGQLTQARQHYLQALLLSPEDADIYNNLGNVERELGNLSQAIDYYQQAIQRNPQLGHALVHLIHQKQHACDWHDLYSQVQQVQSWVSQQIPMQISPFAFLSMPDTCAKAQLECANLWLKQRYQSWFSKARLTPFSLPKTIGQSGKIRLGYLSADFRQHPLASLVTEILELHQRNQFEVYAYSTGKNDETAERQRFQHSVDYFRDIRTLSIELAAQQIHADQIDILIDLTGFTQNSRAQITALKPAPISINWLGFPGTMGAGLYDYIVADAITIPDSQACHYAEQVLRMPHCYQPNDRQRPQALKAQRKDHGLSDDAVVYACFNQTFKILPEVFSRWMQILKAVPNSVLWLLECNTLAKQNLLIQAQQAGITPTRLIFAPRVDRQTHLSRLALADLFLDTLPYNAHTTASDALWVGLPVLTCCGETFASRVGASLLTAIGLPELICYQLDSYQQRAIQLGLSPHERALLRQKLVQNRDTSALFDSQQFCRDLESLYLQIVSEKNMSDRNQ